MKKVIVIAVFAASGFLFISCSTDREEVESATQKQNEVLFLKQNEGLYSKKTDSIPITKNTSLTEGPGDDPIIIPPPKP